MPDVGISSLFLSFLPRTYRLCVILVLCTNYNTVGNGLARSAIPAVRTGGRSLSPCPTKR